MNDGGDLPVELAEHDSYPLGLDPDPEIGFLGCRRYAGSATSAGAIRCSDYGRPTTAGRRLRLGRCQPAGGCTEVRQKSFKQIVKSCPLFS